MNIYDFLLPEFRIGKPKTLFEQIFHKIQNPVTRCANCLCQYCSDNAEELWRTVKPEEMKIPCFNCDDCQEYTGNRRDSNGCKEECSRFVLSDYGAERNRKKFVVMEGGK